jgi:UPF0716 family protein affecting phage T7 exclusion
MSEIVATIILSLLSAGVGALIWREMGLGLMDEINPDEKTGRTLKGAIYGFIFVWGLYGIIHLLNWAVNL